MTKIFEEVNSLFSVFIETMISAKIQKNQSTRPLALQKMGFARRLTVKD
jgi:hypothetical protein